MGSHSFTASYKLSDADINTIRNEGIYRLTSTGDLVAKRFVKSDCTYVNTSISDACRKSYSDVGLSLDEQIYDHYWASAGIELFASTSNKYFVTNWSNGNGGFIVGDGTSNGYVNTDTGGNGRKAYMYVR